MQVAKYGTINIAGMPSRLYYTNPFRAEEATSGSQSSRTRA